MWAFVVEYICTEFFSKVFNCIQPIWDVGYSWMHIIHSYIYAMFTLTRVHAFRVTYFITNTHAHIANTIFIWENIQMTTGC